MATSAYSAAGLLKKNPLMGTALASGADDGLKNRFMTMYKRAVGGGALGRNEFLREISGEYEKFEGDMMHKIGTQEDTLSSAYNSLSVATDTIASKTSRINSLNKQILATPNQMIWATKDRGPDWGYVARHNPTAFQSAVRAKQAPLISQRAKAQEAVAQAKEEQTLAEKMIGSAETSIKDYTTQLQNKKSDYNTFFGGRDF